MSFTASERSTTFNCDDEFRVWSGSTCQPTVITKLRRAGIEPFKVDSDGMHWYDNIPFEQVSFRSVSNRKPMSEEQRQAAADRLRKARESR